MSEKDIYTLLRYVDQMDRDKGGIPFNVQDAAERLAVIAKYPKEEYSRKKYLNKD